MNNIELFAGGGGLALGLEKAGIKSEMVVELDHEACETLKENRPQWNIIEDDIHNVDFTQFDDNHYTLFVGSGVLIKFDVF